MDAQSRLLVLAHARHCSGYADKGLLTWIPLSRQSASITHGRLHALHGLSELFEGYASKPDIIIDDMLLDRTGPLAFTTLKTRGPGSR